MRASRRLPKLSVIVLCFAFSFCPPLPQQTSQAQQQDHALRTVHGSVWLRFQDGRSESLQGIKVYVLPSVAPQSQYAGAFDRLAELMGQYAGILVESRYLPIGDAVIDEALPRSIGDLAERVKNHELWLRQNRAKLSLPAGEVCKAIRLAGELTAVSNKTSRGMLPAEGTPEVRQFTSEFNMVSDDKSWPSIVASCAVGPTRTNASGKFSLGLQKGSYVLCAVFQIETAIAEWTLAVDAREPGEARVELSNGNAWVLSDPNVRQGTAASAKLSPELAAAAEVVLAYVKAECERKALDAIQKRHEATGDQRMKAGDGGGTEQAYKMALAANEANLVVIQHLTELLPKVHRTPKGDLNRVIDYLLADPSLPGKTQPHLKRLSELVKQRSE